MTFDKLETKEDLVKILKEKGIDMQFISFIDKDNKHDFVYMVNYGDFYGEDACDSYIAYNEKKTLSKEEILEAKEEQGFFEPFNDGVLYEVMAYPVFRDFVQYPITNVKFLTEEELIKELVKLKRKSFYNSLMN